MALTKKRKKGNYGLIVKKLLLLQLAFFPCTLYNDDDDDIILYIYQMHTSVMCDVHGVPITSFPPEEFCDIHQHQYGVHQH